MLAVTACTHRQPTASTARPPQLLFDRQISPFPVFDSTGHAYSLPFLGGFEHPRPQLIDIDGDGVSDLFVQENSGELDLFRRGTDGWRLKAQGFQNIDIGE